MLRSIVAAAPLISCFTLFSSPAPAEEIASPTTEYAPAPKPIPDAPRWPRVGGHFGLALPFATFSSDGTTVIGRDFGQVGITPGITIKLTEHWAVDFEFIAFGRWEVSPERSRTIFVVDPGVVYSFTHVSLGLRLAVAIGDPMNYGLVPIVVVPFKINRLASYFLELDLPVALTVIAGTPASGAVAATDSRVAGALTLQMQTGFAF